MFFPKFHCELNCIEQGWGFVKRIYCMFPTSSKEEDLERNMNAALDSVPLKSMQKLLPYFKEFSTGWQIQIFQHNLQ
jgi:hypothetical protein